MKWFRLIVLNDHDAKEKHPDAGWSSLVARRAHNPKVVGSNPAPATTLQLGAIYYPR